MESYLPATMGSIILAEEAEDPSEKISILCRLLHDPCSSSFTLSVKELAIAHLSEEFLNQNRAMDMCTLLIQFRFFFSLIPKAQTVKVMKRIIDSVSTIPGSSGLQIVICKEMVEWTRAERRAFPRRRLQAKLAALLVENKDYSEALNLLDGLIKELKIIDDKALLVETHLLKTTVHLSLTNTPKARAALTAARIAANAVYVPPEQRCNLDLQMGIIHAEEKDYNTAYSYFFEALDSFIGLDEFDNREFLSLRYMVLCKIMVGQAHHAERLVSYEVDPLRPLRPDMALMKAVADAVCKRSLKLFQIAFQDHKAEYEEDPLVYRHLSSLHGSLLEQNLCRLIEPFSRVEIAHISELMGVPVDHVEPKLCQMILDKKLAGTLDQSGCIVIFDDPKTDDALYTATLQTISNTGKVVDSLFARSAKIIE